MGPLSRARRWVYEQRLRRAFARAHREGRATATPGRHPVIVVLDHPEPFRNPARIVRSAEAFGARAVYVVGTEFFDPLPSGGTMRRVPVSLFATIEEAATRLREDGYTLFAFLQPDEAKAPRSLHMVRLPRKSAFVIGNERRGMSFALRDFPEMQPVSIPQYGEAPCLTSAMAATVALYEYSRQHGNTGADE